MHELSSALPRDVLHLNSAAAGHLTGQVLHGFLCQLVQQVNARGLLDMGVLGKKAGVPQMATLSECT